MKCQPQPVHKLQLKFRPGSVPPYVGLEHIGCSTCDSTLTEDLQFRPIKSSNPNSNDNGELPLSLVALSSVYLSFVSKHTVFMCCTMPCTCSCFSSSQLQAAPGLEGVQQLAEEQGEAVKPVQ